jgi:hypothetical protein
MDKCPKCNSETKIASARKRLAYARKWTEYATICCTNKKCCWSIDKSVYDDIRAEARAEALRDADDCTGCWLDDGKSHHGCLPCRRGDKPDLYKTIAAITQEPRE